MTTIELIALSGISGSGKTTWATAWVAEDPENRVRVNQDDIRADLFRTPTYSDEQEKKVRKLHEELVIAGLKNGKSVVSDNTNLTAGKLQHLKDIARHHRVKFHVQRFHVPFETAQANIANRVAGGGRGVALNILEAQQESFLQNLEKSY